MPTGYTAAIKDGISFETFVWHCARAFGALVMLRDESSDGKRPAEFSVPDFYERELSAARAQLAEIRAMTSDDTEAAARAEFEQLSQARDSRIAEAAALRTAYEAMLDRAREWKAPTADHQQLRSFMCEQIESSIKHDCDLSYDVAPTRLTGQQWSEQAQEKLMRRIGHYAEEHAKEVERTTARNEWVRRLAESLEPTAAP